MLLSHKTATQETQRLQELTAIRLAAKHRAEQLRQEAINAFFQTIGSVALAAARRLGF
jgi:hypothetical protein